MVYWNSVLIAIRSSLFFCILVLLLGMLWLELVFTLFDIYGGGIVEWSHNIGFDIQHL